MVFIIFCPHSVYKKKKNRIFLRGIDVNYCSFGRVESVDRYASIRKKKKKISNVYL